MNEICFTILILYSSVMIGSAALNTSMNAWKDTLGAFSENMESRREENAETNTGEIIEESEEAASSEEEITQVVFEKELKETDNPRISELLNVSGVHFDGFNQEHYHYQIPQFNVNSENAEAVNRRIEDNLSRIIEQEAANMSGGYSLVTNSVTYESFEYGDIVAIVVTVPYPNDCMDYGAYTYDFQNDRELTNAELLEMNMLTEDEFVTEVCRLQKEDFMELVESCPEQFSSPEMINEYIANINACVTVNLPMYLDNNGVLQVYIPFASIAGADWYYRLCHF